MNQWGGVYVTCLSDADGEDYFLIRGATHVRMGWFLEFVKMNCGPFYDLRHLTVEIIP